MAHAETMATARQHMALDWYASSTAGFRQHGGVGDVRDRIILGLHHEYRKAVITDVRLDGPLHSVGERGMSPDQLDAGRCLMKGGSSVTTG